MTKLLCLVHKDGTTTPLATVPEGFDLEAFTRTRVRALTELDVVPTVIDVPEYVEGA